jgi:hypothetical protein
MGEGAKATVVEVIPWEAGAWGVSVHYDDGHRLGYPVVSRVAAEEQVNKILCDPAYAVRVRKVGPN